MHDRNAISRVFASAALNLQQGKQIWALVKAVSIRGHAFVRNPPPAGTVRTLTY